jgi:hypothetical protein
MAMPGEYEYYAARSGLASGSLSDHQLAYFANGSGLAPAGRYSLADHRMAFHKAKLVGEALYFSGTDLAYAYWSMVTGDLTGSRSVSDLKRAAIAGNLPPLGPVEQRRNLFLNPVGAGAKAWEWFGDPITADGTQLTGGPASNIRWQKYTLTGAVAGAAQTLQLAPTGGVQGMPVLGGTQYVLSAYGMFSAGTVGTMGLYMMEEYDAAGVLVSSPNLTIPAAVAAGAWGRNSQVFTTQAATRFVVPNYRFTAANMSAGAFLGVGGVLSELGSVLGSYFDGSFPDGGGNDYQWAATADDSASILMA